MGFFNDRFNKILDRVLEMQNEYQRTIIKFENLEKTVDKFESRIKSDLTDFKKEQKEELELNSNKIKYLETKVIKIETTIDTIFKESLFQLLKNNKNYSDNVNQKKIEE